MLPETMLTRIDDKFIKVYHPKYAVAAAKAEEPKK
jgi:vacuolar-type H+-ATPase subunit B/Vma2